MTEATCEDLKASEEVHRLTLENVLDPIFITDDEGKFTFICPNIPHILGYSVMEIESMGSIFNLLGEFLVDLDQLNRQGKIEDIETVVIDKDGDKHLYLVTVKTVAIQNGTILYVCRDITERKKSEVSLHESQETSRALLNASNDAAFLLELDGRIVTSNAVTAQRVGKDLEDILGKRIYDLLPHNIAESRRTRVEEVIKTGKPVQFEDERSGTIIDHTVYPVKNDEGEVVKVAVFGRDVTDSKRSERALRESEKRFRTLYENAPRCYQSLDENGCFLEVNKTWLTTLGYSKEEVVGRSFAEFLHPEWKGQFKENFPRFMAVGEILGVEFEMMKKDGSTILVKFDGRIGYDDEGNFLQTHCMLDDITELTRKDKEKQVNEARLEALVKLNDMEYSDLNELAEYALEESQRLTQSEIGFINFLSEDETLVTHAVYTKNTLKQCVLPADVSAFKISGCGLWSEAHRKRSPIIVNEYHKTHAAKIGFPDGHPELQRFMSIPVFEGDRIVAVAALGNKDTEYDQGDIRQFRLFMDGLWQIMQRNRTEQLLRESEERFRILFEQAADSIVLVDQKTRAIVDCNQVAHENLGYTHEEFRNLKLEDLEVAESLDEIDRHAATIKRQGYDNFQTQMRAKNGTIRDFYMKIRSINLDGRDYLLGVWHDHTDFKNMEKRLRQIQKVEAIGTLAGGVAHDFNNILSPILVQTELAKLALPKDNPVQENLQEVLKAGHRAKDLVRHILAFSRQEKQKILPFDMGPTVKEVLKLIRATTPSSVEIVQKITTVSAPIVGDPTRIHEVMMNLCSNAVQAMDETGSVLQVELQEVELDQDSLKELPELKPGRYIRLSVSDTGSGIPSEIMGRIFDPYFTTKEVGKGTGMGLAVVHGIVKEHEGAIIVYSEPGQGTTFHVYFPRTEIVSVEKREESEAVPMGKERVLFVDDEEAIVRSGSQMLEQLGYQVESTTSPIEALEVFRKDPNSFDLIITDMTMPHMTGDILSKEMMNIRPNIPIILCTGVSYKIDEQKARSLGIKGWIMKPFVLKETAERIREVLGKESGRLNLQEFSS